MMVGVARLLSVFACSSVVDRFGRKSLMISTAIICIICLVSAGTTLIMEPTSEALRLIPLVAMLIYAFAYSLGVNTVPWILVAEILPLSVKSLSTSISCMVFSISIFLVTNIFPTLMESIGLGYSLFLFAGSKVVFVTVVKLFIPETKGKSLVELEQAFYKSKIEITRF